MNHRAETIITALLLLASVFASSITNAQTLEWATNTNLIKVKADRLELGRHRDVQILRGNVFVTQGNISIRGELIRVHTRNGAISRIYIEGSPVRFQQQLNVGELVQTESSEIDYVTSSWTLVLRGDVKLQSAGWQLNSHTVEYNIRSGKYIASGYMVNKETGKADGPQDGAAKDRRLSVTFSR